jgi:hypothetical protein
LVDATTPEAMDSRVVSGFVGPFGVASRLAAWGAGAGLLARLSGTGLADAIGLDGAPGAEKRWAFADPGHNHWAAREVELWSQSARQAREAGDFDPDLPVAVVLAGRLADRGGFGVGQAAPARTSRHGWIETAAGASHATMLNDDFADVIVRGVEHVMSASVAC